MMKWKSSIKVLLPLLNIFHQFLLLLITYSAVDVIGMGGKKKYKDCCPKTQRNQVLKLKKIMLSKCRTLLSKLDPDLVQVFEFAYMSGIFLHFFILLL